MKKKIVIIAVFILMIAVSVPLFLSTQSRKESYKYDDKIISNKYEYEAAGESIEKDYFYSDSYFKDSGEVENEHLRTFALTLALALNPATNKEENNYNINSILEELTFTDMMYYDLDKHSRDTIGTAIAHKKLNNKYDLVVISLRGSGYLDEWESNLDVGKSGNAKGFDEASLAVLSRLKEYLNSYKIKDYKLLVTGYSRAGAVSGLVGVHINNDLKKYNIDEENLYVYTFEAPTYFGEEKTYNNIHDVINKNDLSTYLYPESWGLYHAGKVEDITTLESNIQEKYLDILSSEKIKDLEEVDKQYYIKKFINSLPKDRNKFAEIYDSVIDVYRLVSNLTSSKKERLINFLKDINLDFGNSLSLLSMLNSDDKSTAKKSYNTFMSNYDKNYSKIKDILDEKEYNQLKEDLFEIFMFIQPSLRNDYRSDKMFSTYLTFGYNMNKLFEEHNFSITLEQVQNKDSYYN